LDCAVSQAVSASASVLMMLCPFPEEDIKGFMTAGKPTSLRAAFNSFAEAA